LPDSFLKGDRIYYSPTEATMVNKKLFGTINYLINLAKTILFQNRKRL